MRDTNIARLNVPAALYELKKTVLQYKDRTAESGDAKILQILMQDSFIFLFATDNGFV